MAARPELLAFAMAALFGGASGCGRGAPEIIAPSLDLSRLRFAEYRYAPLGDFAAKRGRVFPFIDANGDGKYDADDEAVGRCDRSDGAGRCWIDRAQLSVVSTTTDCPGTSGVWAIGDVYDPSGRRVEASLCDEDGHCSERHENAFGDGVDTDALWYLDGPERPTSRLLTLRSGGEVLRNDQVAVPRALLVTDGQIDTQDGLRVHVTAGQTIDLANVVLRHGDETRWRSAGATDVFHAQGGKLEVVVPKEVVDACGAGCEGVLSIAHVWRDDDVFSVSEVRLKVL